MKLKFLLRGIGIGAILMATIMYFIYGKSDKTLSDDEIRARARELGMFTVSEFQEKELNSLKDKLPGLSELKVDEKTETADDNSKIPDDSAKTKNTPSEEGGEAGLSADEGDKTESSTEPKGNKTEASDNGNSEKKPTETGSTEDGDTTAGKAKATGAGIEASKAGAAETGNTEKTDVAQKPKPKPVEKPKNTEPKVISNKVNFSITAGMSSEKVAASLKALGLIDNSTEFNKYLVTYGYADKIKVGNFEIQSGQSYAEIAAKITK